MQSVCLLATSGDCATTILFLDVTKFCSARSDRANDMAGNQICAFCLCTIFGKQQSTCEHLNLNGSHNLSPAVCRRFAYCFAAQLQVKSATFFSYFFFPTVVSILLFFRCFSLIILDTVNL